ncbi:hypothetical protein [Ramlibacter sp.]|uniref:hypothetical protein n=1 Tax=Ramlibacter sp. TaxID=1917967 RepID=UPI0017992629|nr:hypothetical protein [Ramlibacter sp.]MBA2675545.1 hypothetical protein [Ramlibacter sp.]
MSTAKEGELKMLEHVPSTAWWTVAGILALGAVTTIIEVIVKRKIGRRAKDRKAREKANAQRLRKT